jgi:acylphosphatase
MKERVHIFVYGLVQGVFFRSNTVSTAKRMGLTGWVRNRSNGSVEIDAEGDRKKLREFVEWCGHGPEGAKVDEIKKEWGKATGEFSDFKARSTF